MNEFPPQHQARQPGREHAMRPQPAPCFVFLANEEASYMTGQVLHPSGGSIVGA